MGNKGSKTGMRQKDQNGAKPEQNGEPDSVESKANVVEPKTNVAHEPIDAKPKTNVVHEPTYAEPKTNVAHEPNDAEPKTTVAHEPNDAVPKTNVAHEPTDAEPKTISCSTLQIIDAINVVLPAPIQNDLKHQQSPSVLMALLREKTEDIAGEEVSLADFSNQPITPVISAMVRKSEQIDDESQMARNIRPGKKNGADNTITCDELFPHAKNIAQKEAEQKFMQDRDKQNYVEKHGNVIGVVGDAGMGKTTLAKKWAMQGLKKGLFGETSFFFFIVVRRIDFAREMTLLQFLLSPMNIECNYEAEDTNILNAICNDPNVVIIIDGFDEAGFESFSTEVPQPQRHLKYNAENYLKHLAGGNLLPLARKIFTSRPTQLYKLNPSYRPRFIVQILGLTPTSQRDLGLQICGDEYNRIKQQLVQNSNVFAYCCIPVNFILTIIFLKNNNEDVEFVSLTRVFAFTCSQYVTTNHLKNQEGELDKLAKFAWRAFSHMQYEFEVKAFEDAGIHESTTAAFTNTSLLKDVNPRMKILERHKIRYFSHLTWQEFFTAFYLMMIMSSWDFETQLKQLLDRRWEVVSKFVFGMCNVSVFMKLQPLLPKCSIEDWKQKKSLLLEFIQSQPNFCKTETKQICSWAYESNDPEIASFVASLFPDELDLRDSSSLPADIESISFVIKHRKIKLKKLDLSRKKIDNFGAASVARCIPYIEEVILRECGIGSDVVEILCGGLKALSAPLKRLDLTRNKIGDSGAVLLAPFICNFKELLLQECEIGVKGIEKICDEVEKLTTPMELLYIPCNTLTDETAVFLARCVHNINKLDVSGQEFSLIEAVNIGFNSQGTVRFGSRTAWISHINFIISKKKERAEKNLQP